MKSKAIKNDDDNFIILGIIVDAYHMNGLVKIKTFTEKPENLNALTCYFENNEIIDISFHKLPNIFRIKGVNTRTDAEKLINHTIHTKREFLPPIQDEESFYIQDLLRLKVYDTNDQEIGLVIGCFNFGAGDIIEIEFLDHTKEMMLFNKANFPEINKGMNKLICNRPI